MRNFHIHALDKSGNFKVFDIMDTGTDGRAGTDGVSLLSRAAALGLSLSHYSFSLISRSHISLSVSLPLLSNTHLSLAFILTPHFRRWAGVVLGSRVWCSCLVLVLAVLGSGVVLGARSG